MDKIKIDLRFEDKGYGIMRFVQSVEIGDEGQLLQLEAKGSEPDEAERVNAIVTPAFEWFLQNQNKLKDTMAQELVNSLDNMRKDGEKNVPDENYAIISEKLPCPHRIAFYATGAFDIFYWIYFNDMRYAAYLTINRDFSLKNAGILTMGGFKPPKSERKPNMSTAAALYAFHKDGGETDGLYKRYIALPAKEIEAYIDLFIADGEELDERIDCLLYLALFSWECGQKLPDRLYEFLLENKVFYYGEIYLRADERFAERLTRRLSEMNNKDELMVNHILCALAAIPCRHTNDFLVESSRAPLPKWARKLHIPPKDYAYVGGWETEEGGLPHKLTSDHITAFKRCKKEKASPLSPVATLPETCGFCGQPLTLVFDDSSNGRQKMATCLHCSCYQTVYTKVDGDGGVHFHPKNAPDEFFKKNPKYMSNDEDIAARFEYGLCPMKENRLPTYTANEFAEISLTQIGGMPTAINDIHYPVCPDCGRTMGFAAQFDVADVEEIGEGLYYFFSCPTCGTVASNYDQS